MAASLTGVLRAEHVSKSFGAVTAVSDVSFELRPGEALSLLGANGAGKTTLINLLLGFVRADSGKLAVAGHDPSTAPEQVRRHVAYVPENVALYPMLTGWENLALFDGLSGKQRVAEDYIAFLSEAGLDAVAARQRVSTYSKGMRQKVGLAIARAKEASILIMDEPLSGLDPQAANEFGARVLELRAAGCAVLMATHDIFRAKEVSDQVGIMKQGRLIETIQTRAVSAIDIERIYLEHMRSASWRA